MISNNDIPISVTNVFTRNRNSTAKYVLNRGGGGSGKSHGLGQLMVEYLFTIPSVQILILRKTLPSLRLTTLPLVERILDQYGLRKQLKEERGFLNFWNGDALMHFGSLDDPQKIKSSEWNVIWLEEADEFNIEDVMILDTRLRANIKKNNFKPKFRNRMFFSFNPTDEFCYLKEEILEKWDYVEEIVSTWRDNPFLSDDGVRTLLEYEKKDRNKYRIYCLGEWGHEDHIIFNNWEIVPEEQFKTTGSIIYGLDFGYTAPSALLKLYVDSQDVYIEELLYKDGLTNTDLIIQLNALIPKEDRKKYPIYADDAEPARIAEIERHGFWVIPSEKDNKAGIDYVRSCKLNVTNKAKNFIKEIKAYTYRKDKNGRILEEPNKINDHTMSALRYALWSHYLETTKGRPKLRSFG